MKINSLSLALMLLLTAGQAQAAPRTKAQMQQAAQQALLHPSVKLQSPKKSTTLRELKHTETYTIFGYEEGGFAVIAADDLLPEILGVSNARYSNGRNTNFNWWLDMIQTAANQIAKNGLPLKATPTPSQAGYPDDVPSLMTTKWDQEEPYNIYCPGSGYGKCLTGCVATAMAQVLKYHRMPEHGIGQHTIYYGSESVTADFSEHYYDWDNMLDTYYYGQYNDVQANAVATLMRDCGVAAEMQYGSNAEGGSGAYSQDAAAGLREYFGLMDAQCVERDNYSDTEWMDMVYYEISENGPIYYGGSDLRPSVWGGHAFVLDGYRADGMVSVNWGWSGEDDGYYNISLLNPSYYQFDSEQDMIIGLKHEDPVTLVADVIELEMAGTLAEIIESKEMEENTMFSELKVSGDINSDDLRYLREQAGCDDLCEKTNGRLEILDLSEARFVEGGNPFIKLNNANLVTSNDVLPERAFYGCKRLKSVKLPQGIKEFGKGAFALCNQLTEIELTPAEDANFILEGNYVYNTDMTELIALLPMQNGELELPETVTSLGDYALAGCSRLTKVMIPATLKTLGAEALRGCSSLKEIRVAAKEIPTLTGGNVFDGIPYSNCRLYVRSGMKTKFSKASQWRAFADNGDNIFEYGTTIKASNMARDYGDDNPVLGYQIKGDHVTGTPVITCEADRHSPAGRYAIHIEPGTIEGDAIDFEEGYLVVKRAKLTVSVKDTTRQQFQENPEEYEFEFEGFRNDDDASMLDELPMVLTEATPESEVGEYILKLEGGSDDCYEYELVDGILTVTEYVEPPIPTAISSLQSSSDTQHPSPVYDLQGRRINTQRPTPNAKGVYIVNGRKVVVR